MEPAHKAGVIGDPESDWQMTTAIVAEGRRASGGAARPGGAGHIGGGLQAGQVKN